MAYKNGYYSKDNNGSFKVDGGNIIPYNRGYSISNYNSYEIHGEEITPHDFGHDYNEKSRRTIKLSSRSKYSFLIAPFI